MKDEPRAKKKNKNNLVSVISTNVISNLRVTDKTPA